MKTRVFLKYFVRSCQAPSNLICLKILVSLRSLTQFSPKVRATKLQESAEIFFHDHFFFDLFAAV